MLRKWLPITRIQRRVSAGAVRRYLERVGSPLDFVLKEKGVLISVSISLAPSIVQASLVSLGQWFSDFFGMSHCVHCGRQKRLVFFSFGSHLLSLALPIPPSPLVLLFIYYFFCITTFLDLPTAAIEGNSAYYGKRWLNRTCCTYDQEARLTRYIGPTLVKILDL